MAWTAVIPTALLPLVSGPAEAEQRKAYNKAHAVHFRSELKAGQTDKLTPAQWKKVDAARMKEAANRAESRPLSAREMLAKGRGPYRSKYFAGTLPWHRSLRDVNLANGNLFKSFTDIQVAPAKGAGLAMQRTYNSQDDRIGPFGQGWTHAYDIRTEEENPDANRTDDSLNYMDRSDFIGARHKYYRDPDGLYIVCTWSSVGGELQSAYRVARVLQVRARVRRPLRPTGRAHRRSERGTTATCRSR